MVELNSTFLTEIDYSFNVNFRCPICDIKKSVMISKEQIKSTQNLTTVAIPKNFMCPHSFSAFIDKNGMIRGYQKNDLEIISLNEPEETTTDVEISERFLKLKLLLGDEIFLKCLKATFHNFPICCITDNQFIRENFHYFFSKIFQDYTPTLFITSLSNYNNNLRKELIKLENVFIFSTRLSSISQQPFEEKFNSKDFELETFLINSVDINNLKDSLIAEYLSTLILKLFKSIEEIKNQIESAKITNKSQIQKILKKVFGKKFNKNVLDDLLKDRYGLDITKKFLNGFFGTL